MGQSKELTLSMLKEIAKEIKMPEVKLLSNGLYEFPEGIIGNEKFLKEFNDAIINITED